MVGFDTWLGWAGLVIWLGCRLGCVGQHGAGDLVWFRELVQQEICLGWVGYLVELDIWLSMRFAWVGHLFGFYVWLGWRFCCIVLGWRFGWVLLGWRFCWILLGMEFGWRLCLVEYLAGLYIW